MKIGKNIKKIRQVKGFNQEEFATLFSLSRATVGAYEEERALPKIDTLLKIANYFSISVDGLINDTLTVNQIHGFNKVEGLHLKKKNKDSHIISHFETTNNLVKNKPDHQYTLPFSSQLFGQYISLPTEQNSNKIKLYKISSLIQNPIKKAVLICTNNQVYFLNQLLFLENDTIQCGNTVLKINEIITFAEYIGLITLDISIKNSHINNAMEERIKNLEKTMQSLLNKNKNE